LYKDIAFFQWFKKIYCGPHKSVNEWKYITELVEISNEISNFIQEKCVLTSEEEQIYRLVEPRLTVCSNSELKELMKRKLHPLNSKLFTPLPDDTEEKFIQLIYYIYEYQKIKKVLRWFNSHLGFDIRLYVVQEYERRLIEKKNEDKKVHQLYINRCLEFLFNIFPTSEDLIVQPDDQLILQAHLRHYHKVCEHSVDIEKPFGFTDWYVVRNSLEHDEYNLDDAYVASMTPLMGVSATSLGKVKTFNLDSKQCLCKLIRPFNYSKQK
jgi:hypothetical protein